MSWHRTLKQGAPSNCSLLGTLFLSHEPGRMEHPTPKPSEKAAPPAKTRRSYVAGTFLSQSSIVWDSAADIDGTAFLSIAINQSISSGVAG